MASLSSIAVKFEAFAESVVQAAVEEGKEFGEKVIADAQDSFSDLVDKVGDAATQFVTDLFSDNVLSGLEKANLAATQLVEHATTNGITIAEQDVTALIKNAYLAVKSAIASI